MLSRRINPTFKTREYPSGLHSVLMISPSSPIAMAPNQREASSPSNKVSNEDP
ncbi:hypothetical protein BDV32DRAFT_116255 [Aspergillus pseudonomiae]|uniref:Uncharacterized protein n=1 Tax=Aspergillus pseudonomiae TaxID=1506151 RepID=A0A5N6IFX8_9EURO|nr:uncharacterized protein BDV37DRAFT_252317 [Aspergillus pseudonomiae]KAB8265236.1 hypothetical protein BDV32DRAFT_116255 [Aspergillus pseudonomiae]KAE8402613.1 hypothetical protein BDV37DRAFT_252317 [Aspergillus pseudonomiae]